MQIRIWQVGVLVVALSAFSAFADREGRSDGFIFTDNSPAPSQAPRLSHVAPTQPAPVEPEPQPAASSPMPVPRPRPVVGSSATPGSPEVKSPPRGCGLPRPIQTDTPLVIEVDQQRQQMVVRSPDFPEPLVIPVSTGGGLKIPNERENFSPEYACTPELRPTVITAIQPSDFKGTSCSQDEIRNMSTAFAGDSYRSGKFTMESGEGVVLSNALRVDGGIFIHRVLSKYVPFLGKKNVSGGCIRVPGWTKAPEWVGAGNRPIDSAAMSVKKENVRKKDGTSVTVTKMEISETLFKQMKKHGAMKVSISPPPDAICYKSLQENRRMALTDAAQYGYPGPGRQATGTDGVLGGPARFFQNLFGVFGGTGYQQPARRR